MKKLGLMVAATLLMAGSAFAADSVAGKWSGEMQGRQGPQPVVLELKADGSGTMTSGQQPAMAIEEGKVAGSKVTFTITREIQGNKVAIKYTGDVNGDELSLTRELPNMGGGGGAPPPQPPAVLKRTK